MVYRALTSWPEIGIMTAIDRQFAALRHRMGDLSVPGRSPVASPTIASLIDRVNAAKQRYQPR